MCVHQKVRSSDRVAANILQQLQHLGVVVVSPLSRPGRKRFSRRNLGGPRIVVLSRGAQASPGLLVCESHAHQDADRSDAREEDYHRCIVSARDISDPEQDVTDEQIKERPHDVYRWR
jgi:hypothetical protein